jgi:hypothetical protein
MAAFIIADPAKQNDIDVQQLAGVQSALIAYQSMRTARPSVRFSAFDKLLEAQKRGDLPRVVREAYRRCSAAGNEEAGVNATPGKPIDWQEIWDQPNVAVVHADPSRAVSHRAES